MARVRRYPSAFPSSYDPLAQASEVSLAALPGVVVLFLRYRDVNGVVRRQMTVEMTPDIAQQIYDDFEKHIAMAKELENPTI